MIILAPISAGELLDKITILRVKEQRLADPDKLANVRYELEELLSIADTHFATTPELDALVAELQAINAELWDIEDGKRAAERRQVFDDAFIRLARDVYLKNDERARIKRRINVMLGSTLIEEKSHSTV